MMVYEGNIPHGAGPEACGSMCETTMPGERGYRLFAVVDGAQCHCGHKFPGLDAVLEEESCLPCDGNANKTCGASMIQSVYQACKMPMSAWVSEGEYVGGLQTTGDLAFERGYCKLFASEGGWGLEHPGNPRSSHIWQKCEPRTISPPYQVNTNPN